MLIFYVLFLLLNRFYLCLGSKQIMYFKTEEPILLMFWLQVVTNHVILDRRTRKYIGLYQFF